MSAKRIKLKWVVVIRTRCYLERISTGRAIDKLPVGIRKIEAALALQGHRAIEEEDSLKKDELLPKLH